MTAVQTAELAICAVLALPVLFIIFKHRLPGLLGWAYLFIFCTLRIVGGGMALSDSPSASLVANIGLSPLILAAAGILHESRFYRYPDLNEKVEWIVVLMYHIMVAAGVGILAAGASSLEGDNPTESDFTKLKVGISILVVAWVVLVAWATITLLRPGRGAPSVTQAAATKLLWSVVVSLLFIGIRLIYTLAIFVSDKKALDPNHGSLAERVVLTLIPELITLVIFIVAGLLTRNVKQDADVRSRPHHFGKKQQELEVDSSVV